jgi:hypothetical protein
VCFERILDQKMPAELNSVDRYHRYFKTVCGSRGRIVVYIDDIEVEIDSCPHGPQRRLGAFAQVTTRLSEDDDVR